MTSKSTHDFKKKDDVQWKWGSNFASGQIEDIYTDHITKHIKGTAVTRNATKEEPAYLIRQENGHQVLKSHSELEAVK